jgi:hypothetical protein
VNVAQVAYHACLPAGCLPAGGLPACGRVAYPSRRRNSSYRPVEGARNNLIKDRMARSGMRWTEQMPAAVVKLRAICLSGDSDDYWYLHIEPDRRRLYPAVWSVVPK